jgi:hypothetical protein
MHDERNLPDGDAMSTTGNEYEKPGVNYPDRNDVDGAGQSDEEDRRGAQLGEPDVAPESTPTHEAVGIGVVGGAQFEGADHHGKDGGRDTVDASEAQRALGDAQEQRLPAMSQNNASDVDKIAGIVAQTRQDVAHLGRERVVQVLAERFRQTGVPVPDDEIQELATQVIEGDA